jgi:hypothetical protein
MPEPPLPVPEPPLPIPPLFPLPIPVLVPEGPADVPLLDGLAPLVPDLSADTASARAAACRRLGETRRDQASSKCASKSNDEKMLFHWLPPLSDKRSSAR